MDIKLRSKKERFKKKSNFKAKQAFSPTKLLYHQLPLSTKFKFFVRNFKYTYIFREVLQKNKIPPNMDLLSIENIYLSKNKADSWKIDRERFGFNMWERYRV